MLSYGYPVVEHCMGFTYLLNKYTTKNDLYRLNRSKLLAAGGTALTRHALEQLGIAHLTLPDVCENVLHSFRPPQEVKHSQVMTHALPGEHLTQV